MDLFTLRHSDALTDLDLAGPWGQLLVENRRRRAYTDLSPHDIHGYIDRWRMGHYRPVLVLVGHAPIALHWLHDMDDQAHSAWCGAWLSPLIRGQQLQGVKSDYWHLVQAVFTSWGYVHLFANVIGFNHAAIAANQTYWGWHYLGRYIHHRPVGGVPTDAMLFSRFDTPEDRALCFQQAHQLAWPDPGVIEPS